MIKYEISPEDPKIKAYLKDKSLSFEELKEKMGPVFRNQEYPAMAHEMSHLHPFFGGVGNKDSKNKWEQEMICIHIDSKMWEEHGNKDFINKVRAKAKEQAKEKDFYKELEMDLKESNSKCEEWERLLYPFLEKEYGKNKLVEFFHALFKEKTDFEPLFEKTFGKGLKDTMKRFQENVLEWEDSSLDL